jgi:hypothetical protein
MSARNANNCASLIGACTDVVQFASRLGFDPDPLQSDLLACGSNRGIVCCHRQWGKSTSIAIKAVHHAAVRADSLTLIVAPSLRQSVETMRKIQKFARALGVHSRSRTSLTFPNSSRIVALPESEHTIVGYSAVTLLVIDEAARVPDPTYHALRPMLVQSAGALWLLSTPLGKRGFFYESWKAHNPGWTRIHAPVTSNPRIPPDRVDDERRNLPASRFNQDYMCEFLQSDDAIFREDDIQAIFRSDIEAME